MTPNLRMRQAGYWVRSCLPLAFNMNFAPVADVNTNPDNPVIGDRSFGSDPYKVGLMVQAMSKGMQEQNVCTVLKHFPVMATPPTTRILVRW